MRQALEARWGVSEPRDLPRALRAVAFQKVTGAVLAVEDEGDVAFLVGQRAVVRACFARYLGGAALDGPPWRVDPYETMPSMAEWEERMRIFL